MKDKIIKLTNAVYNLLEYFPESDPLRNKAKEKALEIFENPKPEDVDILLGYFKIAKMQGWLNSVNYLIIVNEYKKLKKPAQKTEKIVGHRKSHKLTGRQEKILDFLQKNQRAQVMDLMAVLPKVTKRTIRRDLDELLKMGKVVRTGEFNQVSYCII